MKAPDIIGSAPPPDRSKFKQLKDNDSNQRLPLEATRRAVSDVIELSEGRQKAINLALATELGANLPSAAKNPSGFREALKQGYEDIKRITSLFSEVLTLLRGRL